MSKNRLLPLEGVRAYQYLAETIVQYVQEGFSLTALTGEGHRGGPDPEHLQKLQDALATLGFQRAAQVIAERASH